MHAFNYQLLNDNISEYCGEGCILHPTNSHCKIYDDWLIFASLIQSIKKRPIYGLFLMSLACVGFSSVC